MDKTKHKTRNRFTLTTSRDRGWDGYYGIMDHSSEPCPDIQFAIITYSGGDGGENITSGKGWGTKTLKRARRRARKHALQIIDALNLRRQ